MAEQQELCFRRRDGARPGAGRPRTSQRLSHRARPPVSRHVPHHVTVRVARGTWNLRAERCFRWIRTALTAVHRREGFRVVHFSVQRDHVHLITEADDRRQMSNGMRALLIRIARRLDELMGARGPRFADRYHEHALKTPTETRNALLYVLGNRARHLEKEGLGHLAAPIDIASSHVEGDEPLVRPPSAMSRFRGGHCPRDDDGIIVEWMPTCRACT